MHTDIQKINCLIVDDEPLAQEVIANHIAKIPILQLVHVANNAMEAFEALHKNNIDLIFMDINMPVISGLNFLRSLKEPPAVILTTAYPEYAIDGHELDVIDYLLKPIPHDRFYKAVQKVVMQLNHKGHKFPEMEESDPNTVAKSTATNTAVEKKYFFVKADGKLVKINYLDLKYIEGMKDYLKIHTTGGTVVIHSTMKAMEEQLPTNKFLRVHKSYIIALNAIKAIDGSIIHLDIDKGEIPMGSSYKESVLQAVAAL